jgi:hypothetical protein
MSEMAEFYITKMADFDSVQEVHNYFYLPLHFFLTVRSSSMMLVHASHKHKIPSSAPPHLGRLRRTENCESGWVGML